MKDIYEKAKEERMKKNGERKISSDGYIYIRVNSYIIAEHRYIWEQHNGKIPEGFMVHHKNEDKQDNRIENLECISKKEHGKSHRMLNRKRIIFPSGAIKVTKLILPIIPKSF
jgi:hypothetical protein